MIGRALAFLLLLGWAGCEGAVGDVSRVDLDLAGCVGGVQAFSLLVRVEGTDDSGMCTLAEKCLEVSFNGASADDIEDVLRSQGFPLFDVAADEIERVTIGLSAVQDCSLGVLTTGCGSSPISADDGVVTINLDCGNQPACPVVGGVCNN